MILPIYIYGSPVLRKVAREVTPDYPELKTFIDDLWETMYESDGVGLAAPQVGKSVRIFIVDATAGADDDPSLRDFRKTFINPHIYDRFGEEITFNEGCLSLPGLHEDVVRPDGIRIRYMDENFQPHEDEFTGYASRVIQHEYDHLDGKMFVDHLSSLRKTLIKSKLLAFTKGKYNAAYRCKLVKK